MKSILKCLISISLLLGIFACSSLPTEENSASTTKSSVKFTMENIANSANSNILFSTTDGETPSKVALTYKKSGEEEEVSTTIELTAFGNSYITDDVLSLYEGIYVLTKFDVLNDTGETIYSTPVSGSDIATSLDITTPLAHNFEVNEGEISKVDMQVVEVSDTTNPADFGHAAFTFDKVDFSKFYIDVLVLDETEGWVYTTAQVEVKNAEGSNIKTASIDGKMNKVIVANSTSYTITISKDGYASQELSFSKDDLAKYETEAMVVKLKKNSNIVTDGLVAYFPFNGNANDESGTGNNGTINGNITFSENGAYFDGSSYISVPSNSTLNPDKELTIAFWINTKSYTNYWSAMIHKGGTYLSGYYNREYSVWINRGNFVHTTSAGDNSGQFCLDANCNLINNWVFYVGVIDRLNHTMKVYLNNELVSTITDNYSSFNNNNKDLFIGYCEEYEETFSNFNGYLDELRIYKKALSEDEITELFNKGH